MKGIAILCVVGGHYFSFSILSTFIWSFHMPLFVFLNGYFFKKGAICDRLKKSWVSYMKPYILVWLILILLESLIAYYKGDSTFFIAKQRFLSGFWALASNRALFRPEGVVKIGVIWFLNALFIGTVLQSITLKIRNLWLQILFVTIIFLGAIFWTSHICLPFGLNYGSAFLVWLWIGYYYSQKCPIYAISFIESKRGFYFFLVIWIGIVVLEGLTRNQYNICWLRLPLYGVELIGAFGGIIVVMYVSRYIEKKFDSLASSLRYLGISSLWILCIHAIDVELFPEELICVNFIRFIIDIVIALTSRKIYKILTTSQTSKI